MPLINDRRDFLVPSWRGWKTPPIAEGRDTTKWENRLFSLIEELSTNKKVLVRVGRSGFCTCELSSTGLCCGCWKVVDACACKEIEVDPNEEITKEYAKYMRNLQ